MSQLSNEELLKHLNTQLELLRAKMPDIDLSSIQNNVEKITEQVQKIEKKVDELQIRILDPDTGLTVRLNKLNQSILSPEELFATQKTLKELSENDIVQTTFELKKFKSNVVRLIWIIIVAIIGIITNMVVGEI